MVKGRLAEEVDRDADDVEDVDNQLQDDHYHSLPPFHLEHPNTPNVECVLK
jgi:hypothetical protein